MSAPELSGLAKIRIAQQARIPAFTQDDVDMLRFHAAEHERAARWCPPGYVFGIVDEIQNNSHRETARRLNSLADRIALHRNDFPTPRDDAQTP